MMRVVSHLYKVAKAKSKYFFCKHESFTQASCPFTGMTYTYCESCNTRMKAEMTETLNEK